MKHKFTDFLHNSDAAVWLIITILIIIIVLAYFYSNSTLEIAPNEPCAIMAATAATILLPILLTLMYKMIQKMRHRGLYGFGRRRHRR